MLSHNFLNELACYVYSLAMFYLNAMFYLKARPNFNNQSESFLVIQRYRPAVGNY